MDKMSAVTHALGGHHETPKKEISEIRIKKSHNGGHVITHKHHSPEHHPDETHTTKGDDELAEHVMKHAGDPNEGEAADPSMQGAAPMTASPSPMGSGAPAPGGAAPAPTAMA
jgi:hypothetical protein